MVRVRFALAVAFLALAPSAHAQLIDAGSGGLRLIQDVAPPVETAAPAEASASQPDIAWIDVAKMVDQYRIPEKIADLRGVAVDPSGKNAGFYFVSGQKKSFTVYRNGNLVQKGTTESIYDLEEPVVFRMTASGDLLYALHATDLYVNVTLVSKDLFSYATGADSVHEHGGLLTFPEGGNIAAYDVARNVKTVLFKHKGAVQYVRRAGGTIAYTLLEKGIVRMYRNGRLVSPKAVENPRNFAVSASGDVYFFTKAARGYSLYRNTRSFVTGKGAGAFVDVDPAGRVWHVSYLRDLGVTTVRLQRDRSPANLLPSRVANVELHLGFPSDGYAVRASFDDDPSSFFLVSDGEVLGEPFSFDYPYGDTHGFLPYGGGVAFRGYRDARWKAFVDGVSLDHATLKTVRFIRASDGALTVYATK